MRGPDATTDPRYTRVFRKWPKIEQTDASPCRDCAFEWKDPIYPHTYAQIL